MWEDGSDLSMILSGDPVLFAIVCLSLLVSCSAVFFSAVLGIPSGALVRRAQEIPKLVASRRADVHRTSEFARSIALREWRRWARTGPRQMPIRVGFHQSAPGPAIWKAVILSMAWSGASSPLPVST
jgi:hypothetical protein